MLEEESEDNLKVNIKLPNGEDTQLIICPSDDKMAKLNEFIAKHQLSEKMGAKLTQGILRSLEC